MSTTIFEQLKSISFEHMPNGLLDIFSNFTNKREMNIIGLGLPKTGTSSLAAMFGSSYRAGHEALAKSFIPHLNTYLEGELPLQTIKKLIVKRYKLIRLDVDATSYLHHFSAELQDIFPEAKFIITIRDCFSWLDSIVNHMETRYSSEGSPWLKYRDIRFGKTLNFTDEEEPLRIKKLYPVSNFLNHWQTMNANMLASIPQDRRIVVKTDELNGSIPQISEFAKVPVNVLKVSHANKAKARAGIIQQIPKEYIIKKSELHCSKLMAGLYGGNWQSMAGKIY